MNETQISQITASDYDNLLEERQAYKSAGMTAKVAEWDYKITSIEMSQKYERIDFDHIAKEFGIEGLNQALAEKKRTDEEKIKEYCGSIYGKSRVSERALDKVLDGAWQWENDPKVTEQIIRAIAPNLASPTARDLYLKTFRIKDFDPRGDEKVAFIKIQKISDYMQNDNPPMEELMKTVEANVSNLFHCLYIAFPMIGKVKEIDPIIFGTLQDPTKSYDELNNAWNSELTIDRLSWGNFGDMYRVAQWV